MTGVPVASYWLAAAESGFARHEDWAAWADKWIEHLGVPPTWLLDLSLAHSREDVRSALASQIDREAATGGNSRDMDAAVLGYMWLRLERGDFDLPTCLELAGRHADNYDPDIDCEEFYSLLNDLESGARVDDAARELFAPLRNRAQEQWSRLVAALPGS